MARLKTIRLPVSANLKVMLVLLALCIVAGTLFFVQGLVDELKLAERRTITFYANTLQALLSAPQDDSPYSEVASELALDAAKILYFPVIVTDANGNVMYETVSEVEENRIWVTMNVEIDTTASIAEQERVLKERLKTMRKKYDPLPIYSVINNVEEVASGDSVITRTVTDTSLMSYLYYDDSSAIDKLQLLPWIEILIISMFILIGYIGFSHIKRSEQSNIWVGMAKETAHQLGTPLSSLMGWIELLRLDPRDQAQVLEAADEMSRDVDRLTTVAQRFSKIGSAAQTKPVDLNEMLSGIVGYFERRLPHLGKRVVIAFTPTPEPLHALINVELMQWVFENLVRNAADAIDRQEGRISITAHRAKGEWIVIEVSDNGKGIDPKIRKDIFRPGFSTKQRGWGLGLSLAKRIVEEYHGGKIAVKESSAEGTTFSIRLPASVEGAGEFKIQN